MILLSFLDQTPVGLDHYSKRENRGCGNSCYTPCELTENFGRAMHSVLLIAKRSRSNLRSLACASTDSASLDYHKTASWWVRNVFEENLPLSEAKYGHARTDQRSTTGDGIFIENMLNAAQYPWQRRLKCKIE